MPVHRADPVTSASMGRFQAKKNSKLRPPTPRIGAILRPRVVSLSSPQPAHP